MSFPPPLRPTARLLDLDRCIDEAFSRLIHEPWASHRPGTLWQPAIDVLETADAYLLEADLPGVAKEDLQVQIEDRQVILTGRRQSLSWRHSERSLQIERSAGEFNRTFTFEMPIDAGGIDLKFEHGILRLRLPKQNLPQPDSG